MENVKLCLDAGHYGKYNQSEVEPDFYESDFNWKHHLLLKKYLEAYGISVSLTRADKNRDMELYDRGRAAEGCDLFLSIHANWAARKTADYPVAYVPINGSGDALGLKLAKCVAAVMGTTEPGDIQSKKSSNGLSDWYGVIYGAATVGVTGIILEHSFYSNERSVKWLMDDENLDRLARAEAEVIAEYYGLLIPDEQEKWYRIRKSWENAKSQKGAYKSLELAKENCPSGYFVYDWNGVLLYPLGYTQEQFVRELQKVIGARVDGIAGSETLSKTPTLSRWVNSKHKAVLPVQKWLYALGYVAVGDADGIAGGKFEKAVKQFQRDHNCTEDGEITAKNKTWRKLLGME